MKYKNIFTYDFGTEVPSRILKNHSISQAMLPRVCVLPPLFIIYCNLIPIWNNLEGVKSFFCHIIFEDQSTTFKHFLRHNKSNN